MFLAFLYAPLLLLVVFSFNDNDLPVFPLQGFTTQAYEQFFANPELRTRCCTSAKVAIVASVVAVVLGLLASIALVPQALLREVGGLGAAAQPAGHPVIVFAIALLILFMQIDKLPVIAVPALDVDARHRSRGAAVARRDPDPRRRASSGSTSASRRPHAISAPGGFRTFRSITLPLIWPALLSAFLVSLVFSFDEIILASFIAGRRDDVPALPVLAAAVPEPAAAGDRRRGDRVRRLDGRRRWRPRSGVASSSAGSRSISPARRRRWPSRRATRGTRRGRELSSAAHATVTSDADLDPGRGLVVHPVRRRPSRRASRRGTASACRDRRPRRACPRATSRRRGGVSAVRATTRTRSGRTATRIRAPTVGSASPATIRPAWS